MVRGGDLPLDSIGLRQNTFPVEGMSKEDCLSNERVERELGSMCPNQIFNARAEKLNQKEIYFFSLAHGA
jgi:hypothetical protein